MRGVLTDLGLDTGSAPKPAGAGGPFVPARLAEASAFERQLYRVQLARTQVDALARTLVAVPVRKPIPGEVDMTSGFGVRVDPFLHGAAMHTGIDLRGDEGEPVRATAAGTVTYAGWQGGYGVVSFGTKDLEWVRGYIRNQREHHARGTVVDRLEWITTDDTSVPMAKAEQREAP